MGSKTLSMGGVALSPASIRNTMRISFVTNPEEDIVEGVTRLARAVQRYRAEQPS